MIDIIPPRQLLVSEGETIQFVTENEFKKKMNFVLIVVKYGLNGFCCKNRGSGIGIRSKGDVISALNLNFLKFKSKARSRHLSPESNPETTSKVWAK